MGSCSRDSAIVFGFEAAMSSENSPSVCALAVCGSTSFAGFLVQAVDLLRVTARMIASQREFVHMPVRSQ